MSAEAERENSDALQELMAIVQVAPRHNLSPIPEGVSFDVRRFTETVRGLFGALEMSLTRFSVQMHCDKGTVSRYLSGERIPPQDFLDRLFKLIYDAKNAFITPEVQSLVHEQYLAALEAHSPARYQLQKLSDELTVAILEKQQSDLTISALQEAIVKKHGEIYALEMEKRAIQQAWAAEQQETDGAIEDGLSLRRRLEQTIRGLRHEVQRLNKQLRSTQVRARAAEERCQQLEAQVDQQLEAQIDSADAPIMGEQVPADAPRRPLSGAIQPQAEAQAGPAGAPARDEQAPASAPGNSPRVPSYRPGRPVADLRAWLYECDGDGTSRAMWDTGGMPMQTVTSDAILHVTTEGGQDTPAQKYLKMPPAVGMASEPVTVKWDNETRCWMIRNSGEDDTLRVQQYGLSAVPLAPQAAMPMSGADVAVWIRVLPKMARRTEFNEAFRLLILASQERASPRGDIDVLTRRPHPRIMPTPATQEALIAYFGDHLSWPPLPAPHVRQQKEIVDIAEQDGLRKEPDAQRWARNRHDVLAGKDGLFTTADWYPRAGGPGRSLANHLPAFHRLVELGSIKLYRVQRWAREHDVKPFVLIDDQLGRRN